jgi:hypothetical protein
VKLSFRGGVSRCSTVPYPVQPSFVSLIGSAIDDLIDSSSIGANAEIARNIRLINHA